MGGGGGGGGGGEEEKTALSRGDTAPPVPLSHCAHTSRAHEGALGHGGPCPCSRARSPPLFFFLKKPQKKNQCPPLTEASLSGLDAAAADLRTQIARVDVDILEAVRAQDAPAGKAR